MKGIFSCFAESAKEFTKLRSLVITALFIAISMIIEAFSIDLQFAKLNFAFLAIAVIGMLFGPCMGLVAGFACDIVGYLVHPTGGFLPAYILVAGLQGLIYGLCLYHKMNGHSIQFRNTTTGKEWDITLFLRAVVARLLDRHQPAHQYEVEPALWIHSRAGVWCCNHRTDSEECH